MKRFGVAHWAIINLLLDNKWHPRAKVEEAVIRRYVDIGKDTPDHARWRGSTTRSLQWMVNNGWALVKTSGPGKESFKITREKKRLYLNWRYSYERDIAKGLVTENGTYKGGHTTPHTARIRRRCGKD